MPTPEEMMLQDLLAKYAGLNVDPTYTRLYPEQDRFSRMLAYFHGQLNHLFTFMNSKARTNRHFNADESRSLIALIDDIDDAQKILRLNGVGLTVGDYYRQVIDSCRIFLSETQGSPIPEDFARIDIAKYEPVFHLPETEIRLPGRWDNIKLKMVGEGAYAIVYQYTDPYYGREFALKRAKRDLNDKELTRFRREFALLKSLRFPYVLEVYRYGDGRDEYTMEYCDDTLEKYITTNNAKLAVEFRKRIALQFLYGLNYIHSKGHLHRDVSYKNVLVKRYDGIAGVVKLSDFGLMKERDSDLTRTESELRGTILDPTIQSFKEYSVINEVYSIGFVLSFIFSGRKHITACSGPVRAIIDKCVNHDHTARYQDVMSIIRDVEALASGPAGTSATPA